MHEPIRKRGAQGSITACRTIHPTKRWYLFSLTCREINQVSCISDICFQSFQYATSGHTTTLLIAALLPFPKSLHDTKRTLLPKSHATWLPSVKGSDRGCQEFPRLSFPSGPPTRNWHVPVGAANSQSLSGCISSYTGHRLLPLKSPLNILNILDLSWKDSCNTILQSLGKKDKTKPKTNEQTKPHHHQNNLTTKQKTAFWEENQNAAPLGIWKTAQNRDHKTAYIRVTTCVQSSLQLLNLSC